LFLLFFEGQAASRISWHYIVFSVHIDSDAFSMR
jgi:hypothetical protein